MKNRVFAKEVEEILPYVLTYASDFYKLKKIKDVDKLIKQIGISKFQNKCHEGFKIAQDKITENLLSIEQESKIVTKKINTFKKNKLFNLLKREKEYKNLITELNSLNFQKAMFQETANCIVWTIFGLDRTAIKALMQPGMQHKSLLEGNIQSLIDTARHYNQEKDKFALITDITSCIGIGDLIIIDTKRSSRMIAEVKEGKVNEVIMDTLQAGNLQFAQSYLLHVNDPKRALAFLKQFKRIIDQHSKAHNAIEYVQKGVGKDLFTGRNKKIIETRSAEEKFSKFVAEGIKFLYSQTEKDELYFPFDCGVVGIIKNPTLARKWDFQHYIIHQILKPKSDCAYTKHKEVNEITFKDSDVVNHFKEILQVPIYNFKSKVFYYAHEPIFFNLPIKYIKGLLENKLSIYIYFDHNHFYYLMKKTKLYPTWKSYKDAKSEEGSDVIKEVVNFEGKCLYFGTKTQKTPLMYGFLLRIVYEFQTAESVVMQLKDLIKKVYKKTKTKKI